MKKNLYLQYSRDIELMAWDVAIAGMTQSKMIQNLIRSSACVGKKVDWKKDPKMIGLLATGGLILGSGLSLATYILH